MERRHFLKAGAVGAGALALGRYTTACAPAAVPVETFGQGVTAGLHSPDAVVLWTRVEPAITAVDRVTWQVATTPDMTTIVASGDAPVTAATDHTVKVLVEGLDPGRSWWYRFVADGHASPVGRARTLPAPDDDPESLRVAFGSCQSYATGYYTAWRDVAQQPLDAVVFLGDFIYESPAINLLRPLRAEPLAEADTLERYREKYRHYRSDVDLRAAAAAHPWSVVWDDHELRNDWDMSVFADDPARFEASSQAWFEYQPVWPTDGTRIHRSFRWGRLGELFVLDSRQYRSRAAEGLVMSAEVADPARTMLGAAQRSWLTDGMAAAEQDGVTWKLVGTPQPMSPSRMIDLDTPEMRRLFPDLVRHAGLYLGLGGWSGYPAERDSILERWWLDGVRNATLIAGDIHAFQAGPLQVDYDDAASPVIAHEAVGGSVSSPAGGPHTAFVDAGGRTSPPSDFVDGVHNGYGVVECRPDAATITLVGVDATVPWGAAKPIYTKVLPAT